MKIRCNYALSLLNLLIAALSVIVLLFVTYSADAFAQVTPSPVDKEGSWYVGEGLEQGDYFHYTICHVDYKECRDFEFEFWIKGDVAVGTETPLLAEVRVRDGYKVIVGNMTLGKITHKPTGSSPELSEYRDAFGSSVTWLSGYATAGAPKAFTLGSWGQIASSTDGPIHSPLLPGRSDHQKDGGFYIQNEVVRPAALENVTVTAGTWEAIRVEWLLEAPLWELRESRFGLNAFQITTGGPVIKTWVVDELPFPIKATTLPYITKDTSPKKPLDSLLETFDTTFTYITGGTLPPEYEFVLRDYEQGVQENPFGRLVLLTIAAAVLLQRPRMAANLHPKCSC